MCGDETIHNHLSAHTLSTGEAHAFECSACHHFQFDLKHMASSRNWCPEFQVRLRTFFSALYFYRALFPPQVGDECLVKLSDERLRKCEVLCVSASDGTYVVFIQELGEIHSVEYAALRPSEGNAPATMTTWEPNSAQAPWTTWPSSTVTSEWSRPSGETIAAANNAPASAVIWEPNNAPAAGSSSTRSIKEIVQELSDINERRKCYNFSDRIDKAATKRLLADMLLASEVKK